MSTILYEDEKFLQIYQTMRCKQTEYAHLFGYPEGWRQSMDSYYQEFIDALRTANIHAYNGRYADADELPYSMLDFSITIIPYPTTLHFYKSLLGLRYNLDSQNINGCAEILNRLIDSVAYSIISKLPAWELIDTW